MAAKQYEVVPAWQKYLLTVEEASAYFSICSDKIREITDETACPYVLWNGAKRLIKRKKLEKYLDQVGSV